MQIWRNADDVTTSGELGPIRILDLWLGHSFDIWRNPED